MKVSPEGSRVSALEGALANQLLLILGARRHGAKGSGADRRTGDSAPIIPRRSYVNVVVAKWLGFLLLFLLSFSPFFTFSFFHFLSFFYFHFLSLIVFSFHIFFFISLIFIFFLLFYFSFFFWGGGRG